MPVAKRPTTQAAPNAKPRNMRSFIPLTRHTNINNFPKIEHRRYPLMPVDENGVAFRDEYGKTIKLYDEDEEAAFKLENPTMRDVPDSPQTQADELDRLRAENARLKAEKADADAAKTDKPQDGKDAGSSVAGLVAGNKNDGNKGGKTGNKPVEPKLD